MYLDAFYLYLLIINIVTFTLYGEDKRRARDGQWRIPEKVLLMFTAAFGSLGALLGMYYFNHKTRKARFYITVPVLLFIHLYLLTRII